MDVHRSQARARGGAGRRGDAGEGSPLDVDWLESQALDYLRRYETTRSGLARALERRIRRCSARRGLDLSSLLPLVPGVVEGLAGAGWVDDRRFAATRSHGWRRQGHSRRWVEARLARMGVEPAVIREVLGGPDPETELHAAWALARRRHLGPHCPDPERRARQRTRHLAVLARQGYSREVAYQVIDAERAADPGGYPAGHPGSSRHPG